MQLPGCRMNSEEFSSTTPESLNLSDQEIKRKLRYAFVPLTWRRGTWQSRYVPNPSSCSIMATES
jgi:hypothetical protein